MGNALRFTCVSFSSLLTAVAVAIFVVLFVQGSSPSRLPGVYYLEFDLRNVSTDVAGELSAYINQVESATGLKLETDVVAALDAAKKAANMEDGYRIGLTNYCSGKYNGDNELQLTSCSEKDLHFYFDPITVWKLNETGFNMDEVLPSEVHDGLEIYRKANRINIIFHIVAGVCCIVALVVSLLAHFTRFGSILNVIVGGVAMALSIAGAGISTAAYFAIKSVFKVELERYGAYASIGSAGIGLDWAAAGLTVLAFLIWMITACCCKRRSTKKYEYSGVATTEHQGKGSPYQNEPYYAPNANN